MTKAIEFKGKTITINETISIGVKLNGFTITDENGKALYTSKPIKRTVKITIAQAQELITMCFSR